VNDDSPTLRRRVLVTGAAGFIGRYLCRRLTDAGYAVTGLVRKHPSESETLTGVTYAIGDIRDRSSLTPDVFGGCDAVVHLVGIITEIRGQGHTFRNIHVEGTRNVLTAALEARTDTKPRHFLYVSAQGASATSRSEYARTKAEAEQLVRESALPWTIFRPSIVLGKGAEFLEQMEGLIRRPPLSPFPLPFVPVPGNGKNRFQPVHVDDLADCILRSLTTPAAQGQTFEVGGADTVTFDELMIAIEERIGVRKPLLHAPLPLMFAAASALEAILPRPPVTVDQLYNLRAENVTDNTAIHEVLGITPMPFADALAHCYE
jgi:nucleoside-diphosphate-sugar epimerase